MSAGGKRRGLAESNHHSGVFDSQRREVVLWRLTDAGWLFRSGLDGETDGNA